MKSLLVKSLLTLLLFSSFSINGYAQEKAKVVQLHVDGMVSPTCPVLLKSAVDKIAGVKYVTASLAENSATIEYDTKITSLEEIQEVIESQVGFTTELNN